MQNDSVLVRTFTCLVVPEPEPPRIDLQAKIDEINRRMAHLQQSNDALRILSDAIDRFRAGEDLDITQLELPLQRASWPASSAIGDTESDQMASSLDPNPGPAVSQETNGSHPAPKSKKHSKFLKIPKFGKILRGPMPRAMAERERASKLHQLKLAHVQQGLEFNSQVLELAVQIREYRWAAESQGVGRGEAVLPDLGSVTGLEELVQDLQQPLNFTAATTSDDVSTQGLQLSMMEETGSECLGADRL